MRKKQRTIPARISNNLLLILALVWLCIPRPAMSAAYGSYVYNPGSESYQDYSPLIVSVKIKELFLNGYLANLKKFITADTRPKYLMILQDPNLIKSVSRAIVYTDYTIEKFKNVPFAGLHFDIEPHTLKNYNKKNGIMDLYALFGKLRSSFPRQNLSASLPYFYFTKYDAYYLTKPLDSFVCMIYSKRPKTVIEAADEIIKKTSTPFYIATVLSVHNNRKIIEHLAGKPMFLGIIKYDKQNDSIF